MGTAVGTLNTVSSDAAIQNTAKVTANDVTIGGGETPTESTTTEATTKETTTEATTEAVTGLAIVGDTVTAKDGKATVTFSLKNNTLGVANYDVFVKYNSSDLIATGGTTPGFNNTGIDVVNVQVKYVPVTGDSDYDGKADGKSTAAEIGILKLSVLNESNVTSDAAVLTVDFDVKATAAGTYPVEITIVSMGDESGKTYTEYQNVDGAVVIEGSTPVESTTEATTVTEATTKVTTEATTEATTKATTEATTEVTTKATTETTTEATETTTRSYHGGGGGGGGSTHNYTTTTTEAATEAVTDSDTEPTTSMAPGEVVINDGTSIKVPTDKVPNFEGFEDLNNYPWAEDSINKLAELGIITGVADKTYGPALPCRRADFAILINRTLGVTVDSVTKNFSDNEDQSKYYYNDLRVGYTAGILSGYGDNNYKPEQYCTREEMAVLVAKTFEWLGKDVTSTALSVNDKYTDVDNISWWSAPYVAYLTDMGIINGNADGTLLPKNYINRAEMAVMMSKVYDYALDYAQSMTTTTTEATTEETTTTTEETTTTTTAAAEDSAAATETAGDSDSEETTATEETAAEETTTEAAVETDENGSEVTTTTTAPYANEQIIAKVTTKEDTKEEDITYTPCKNVYDYAFGDGQKNYGDATIIEDDDAYYIVMSRDIKDRMTEDDLWTESQQNTVISQEYSDAFEDMLDGWTADQKVEKNDSAIKRYDAFKIDMDSSSQSA